MGSLKPASNKLNEKAKYSLEWVGLGKMEHRLPNNLSGGELLRVAIARALVLSSNVLFDDEPTGSIDRGTVEQIITLISVLNQDGLTVVMVTHDPDYANLANRTIRFEDGVMM
jgi:putative ABC transport system ATP-binding protein